MSIRSSRSLKRRRDHVRASPRRLFGPGYCLTYVTALLFSVSASFAIAGQSNGEVPSHLAQELDKALHDRTADYEQQLQLVENIDRHLATADESDETWIKTRLVEALANMRLNRLELSHEQITRLSGSISREKFPELWFRSRSLESAILLFRGERDASLSSFQQLLATDTSKVTPRFVLQARINHAAVLYEFGRIDEAAREYEDVMLFAIENHFDAAALHSGHNLISILFDQGDKLGASLALDVLTPVARRNPTKRATAWLTLHKLNLQRLNGEYGSAIAGIKAVLSQSNTLSSPLVGTAHRILADAYRESGSTEEAIVHARKSVRLLRSRANHSTKAHVALAQVLLLNGDHEGALNEISLVDADSMLVPARQELVARIRLEAKLRKSGLTEEAGLLASLLAADKAHDSQVSKTRSEYFEAKLLAAQRKLQLQEEQARTREAIEAKHAERNYRYLLLTCLGVFAVASYLVVFLYFRNRSERLLLKEQQALTEELSDIVKSRTKELKANLQASARMAQALERKKRIEAIGLLAGNVAHDINNLLQVVANTNESLACPNLSTTDREELLNLSNESLRHGAGIVRNLLAFSRQQTLTIEPLQFDEYIRSTRPLFMAAVGERVGLDFNLTSDDVHVLVDASQLTTSLLNILSNAVDATPSGGKIKFETEVVVADVATTQSSAVPGRYLRITVTDTGCGMSDDEVAQALEPFYSTKDMDSGTGLGLSSTFGFVKQSNGDLRIESQPGAGTRVEILLPLVEAPVTALKPVAAKTRQPLPVRRVLLVEDHDAVAKTLLSVLQRLDFDAVRVCSGEQAQQALKRDSAFDFILSDVNMPGETDGLALARWVNAQLPEMPIFLMSGFSEQLVKGNRWPLVEKPFTAAGLTLFLEENLGVPL